LIQTSLLQAMPKPTVVRIHCIQQKSKLAMSIIF
jgi:hypothetical protein